MSQGRSVPVPKLLGIMPSWSSCGNVTIPRISPPLRFGNFLTSFYEKEKPTPNQSDWQLWSKVSCSSMQLSVAACKAIANVIHSHEQAGVRSRFARTCPQNEGAPIKTIMSSHLQWKTTADRLRDPAHQSYSSNVPFCAPDPLKRIHLIAVYKLTFVSITWVVICCTNIKSKQRES